MPKGKLRVATCQFSESFAPRRNCSVILRHMQAARKRRAELVHFHEGALSGYLAHKNAPSLKRFDWAGLKESAETICQHAKRLRMWVVLGSAHPLTPPHKPTNCLYLISPDGKVRNRYDKRFCTTGDLKVYTPGNRFVTFTLNGIRCALLICFDLRFPELYRKLSRMGVETIFQSFHNAHMTGPGVHTKIMRQTMQGHAGMNYFWVSANNSSGYYSRWGSIFIRPDGVIADSLRQNVAGMIVNTIDTSRKFYDPTRTIRRSAISGTLHSGTLVQDPRLRNRTSP